MKRNVTSISVLYCKGRFAAWFNYVWTYLRASHHYNTFTLSSWFLFRAIQDAGYSVCSLLKPKMKPQLFVLDLIFLCISCGASALATTIPTVSTSSPAATNFTNLGAAHSYGTDSTTISKTRRKRYISQNDMLAILDYHNKVRGKVFPPASNMEYMVSESFHSFLSKYMYFQSMHGFTAAIYSILCFLLVLSWITKLHESSKRYIKYFS